MKAAIAGQPGGLPEPVDHVELRRGVYHDSVTLLRISQAASDTPGILAAQVAMATPLNTELAAGLGFEIPAESGPNDLLVALRGADDEALSAGLSAIAAALASAEAAGRSGGALGAGFEAAPTPRTSRSALDRFPDASLVLLSVPGPAVIGEAMDAIATGRHVMIFSDNVPIDHEIALKEAAAAAGVLVMGPDCGTAVVGGVGLGFANVLGRGSGQPAAGGRRSTPTVGPRRSAPTVGIVAASGTGAQQLTCLLDEAGVPISAVLGLGGRDLSEAVGGRSALAALAMLDADPNTDHIVIISKPPHPATADRVRAAASAATTPVTTVLLGPGQPDLTAAAEAVLVAVGVPVPEWPQWLSEDAPIGSTRPGVLRGLYSGGTLADEAMIVAGAVLGDVRSNIPLRPDLALPADAVSHGVPRLTGLGHVIVDLGDDAFTVGRAHPMIDPSVRLDLLAAQAVDPDVGVVLLDVVLGHGAEPEPARRLAPAIADAIAVAGAGGRTQSVVATLCGTAADPQNRADQAAALVQAGADVFLSNARAARRAAFLAGTTATIGVRL
jgi:succinyl-CoA synthetase alpha subunit